MYDYYTTLDVIVGPTVEATGRPNLLRRELGDPGMAALWDLFVCPEGPRLRDRISHGVRQPHPPPRACLAVHRANGVSPCAFLDRL